MRCVKTERERERERERGVKVIEFLSEVVNSMQC